MVLEEQPSKVAEAVKLFLQGLGYTTVRTWNRSAVSLAGTPVKRPVKNVPAPDLVNTSVGQQPETAELIGGLAELMLKEPK